MPNNRNAEKALRQSTKRRLENRAQTTALRNVVKKVRTTAAAGDAAASQEALNLAAKNLDQAAAKNLIHKNKASRTKSRLAKLLKAKPAAKQA